MTPRKYKITLDQLRMAASVRTSSTWRWWWKVKNHLPKKRISHRAALYFSALQRLSERQRDPSAPIVEKIFNAFDAADYNIRPLYKYVKELEEITEQNNKVNRPSEKSSTLYYLSQHLDRQKNKKK